MPIEQAPRRYRPHRRGLRDEEQVVGDLRMRFRLLWNERERESGIEITKSDPPYTEKQLQEISMRGRSIGYLPPEFRRADWISVLTQFFPQEFGRLQSSARESTLKELQFGWFDYDAGDYPAFLNTPYADAIKAIEANGESGMDFASYLVATVDHRYFQGSFLDANSQRTYTILPKSVNSRVVSRISGDHTIEYPFFVSGSEEGIGDIGRFAEDPRKVQSEEFGVRSIRWASQPRTLYL